MAHADYNALPVWMVLIDGNVFRRGLTRSQADALCEEYVNGFERKRASDKRRIGCFEVKLDVAAHKSLYASVT